MKWVQDLKRKLPPRRIPISEARVGLSKGMAPMGFPISLKSIRWCLGRAPLWGVMAMGAFVMVGCRHSEDPHGMEEEHAHFPEHWPGSLEGAIKRFRDLSNGGERTNKMDLATEVSDLLQWLPELVAESDIDEKGFQEIDSMAMALLARISALQSEEAVRSQGLRSEAMGQLIDRLEQLLKESISKAQVGIPVEPTTESQSTATSQPTTVTEPEPASEPEPTKK